MRNRLTPIIIGVVWLSAVFLGQWALLHYELSPGKQSAAPLQWPSPSRIVVSPGLPTLVILAHPQCPCTRATIEELNVLMARCPGRLTAAVLFFRPHGVPRGWEKAALWRDAVAIPGVQVLSDDGGTEARRYHVETSGCVSLYDTHGLLVFRGGMTGSRGHEGDNPGLDAIESILLTGKAKLKKSPVFGCSILGPDSARLASGRSSGDVRSSQ